MDQVVTTKPPKALKFRALAENRVSLAIKTIRRIGNLSTRDRYEYTPEQVAKMFEAMRDELDAAERKFAPMIDNNQDSLFRLD
jgi:GTP cyclohydrolase I